MSQTETSNSSHSSLDMAHLDIVQIAYHVKDVREAAARMQKQFGAGPFILSENILETRRRQLQGKDLRLLAIIDF